MENQQIIGLVITVAVLAAAVIWGLPSLRRLFLLTIVLGIAGAYRIGGEASGTGIYPYEIVVVGCACLMFAKACARQSVERRPTRFSRHMILLMVGFAVWTLWGLFFNGVLDSADLSTVASQGLSTQDLLFRFFGHILLTLAVTGTAFWAGAIMFDLETDLKSVLYAVVAGTTLSSVNTLIAWFAQTGGVAGRYNFIPPTGLGQGDTSRVALVGAVCCVVILMSRNRGWQKLLFGAFLLVNLLTIAVIQVREGYVGALLQLALLVPLCARLNYKWWERLGPIALVPFVIAFGIALLGTTQLLSRTGFDKEFTILASSDSRDVENRTELVSVGWDLFLSHPLWGVGRGRFVVYNTVPMSVAGETDFVATPHNGVIELLSETGVVGAILAFALSLMIVQRLWRVYRTPHSTLARSFAGALLIMIVYVVVLSCFESSILFSPPVQRAGVRVAFLYWFLAGFVAGSGRKRHRVRVLTPSLPFRAGLEPSHAHGVLPGITPEDTIAN